MVRKLTKLQLSLFVSLLRRVGPSVPPLLFAVGINKWDAFEMAVKRGSVPMILLLRAAGAQATPEVPCLENWLQIEAHAYKNYHFISQLKLIEKDAFTVTKCNKRDSAMILLETSWSKSRGQLDGDRVSVE